MNIRVMGISAGILVLLLLSISVSSYNHLQKEYAAQSAQINTLDNKLLVVTSLLNSRVQNINLDALISIALSKNVKPVDLIMTLKNIQKFPGNAQDYLTQLNFSQAEIQTSLTASAPSSLITDKSQQPKPTRHHTR